MNETMVYHAARAVKLISESLGLPTIADAARDSSEAPSVDEINEDLYERDDLRQFHVPVTQVREGFYTILAKSAADAEGLAWQRLRLARDVDGSFDRWDVGTAIEA
jgi:hypothetical protein